MTTSNRLGITELAETQNNRSVTINEAIAKLEAGAMFFPAVQVSLNAAPGSPVEGDVYVVGTAGSGAFSGHNKEVALFYNAAWLFFSPIEGMFAWDQTSNSLKYYTGSAWTAFTIGSGGIADADYGDVTVSSGVWTIDAGVVTYAKLQDVSATKRVLGRNTAGSGDAEEVTLTQLLDWISSVARGDILFRGAASWERLGAGTAGHVLQTGGVGADPSWGAPTGATVANADYGDITVAAGVWTIDSGVVTNAKLATAVKPLGRQTVWVPAGAMVADTTNGPASATLQPSSHGVIFPTLNFDATTAEYAQFQVRMPKGWDEGTVAFVPVWSHAATATNFGVVWKVDAVACSDDDAGDASFGTGQTSTDTGGTTNDVYMGPESAAITVGGTPAAEDLVTFRVYRVPSDGSDTMAIDARLHGVTLYYTIDAANDA